MEAEEAGLLAARPPLPHAARWAVARCVPQDESAPCGAAVLPPDLLSRVFALLPADARARAACVCGAWHWQLVSGPDAWRAWTRLDLSWRSGAVCTRSDAALVGAAALARGRLQELDLSDRGFARTGHPGRAALRAVLRSNQQLHMLTLLGAPGAPRVWTQTAETLQAVLRDAPALRRLDVCEVCCAPSATVALLRREPPFAPVHAASLFLYDNARVGELSELSGVRAVAAALVAHGSVRRLTLCDLRARDAAALEALVDAALACRVTHLSIMGWSAMTPDFLRPLARLLAAPACALVELELRDAALFADAPPTDARVAALLGAVRANATLARLHARYVGLAPAAEAALRAAAAPSARPSGAPVLECEFEAWDGGRYADGAQHLPTPNPGLLPLQSPLPTRLRVRACSQATWGSEDEVDRGSVN